MKKAFIILIKILILLIGLFFGIMNISRSYITGGVTIIAGIIIWLSINKLSAGSLYPWRQWLWIIISVIAAVGIQVIFFGCEAHYASVDFINAPKLLYDMCIINAKFI